MTRGEAQAFAADWAAAWNDLAVETEAPLKELRGSDTRGFYYSMTDRAPGPGEYKRLSQGVFVTRELMTAFTILNREPVSPQCEQVLRMFEQAKYAR